MRKATGRSSPENLDFFITPLDGSKASELAGLPKAEKDFGNSAFILRSY